MIFELDNNSKTKYLETQEWQEARSERLRIDDFTCQACFSRRNIQVHHTTRVRNDNPNPYIDLITLCEYCHKRIEDCIDSQTFKEGEFEYRIISADKEMYKGSEKMPACERIRLVLLVTDGKQYIRYVKDNLPVIDKFKWKWTQLAESLELKTPIDTDTVCDELIGKSGVARISIQNGDYGAFNKVESYINNKKMY